MGSYLRQWAICTHSGIQQLRLQRLFVFSNKASCRGFCRFVSTMWYYLQLTVTGNFFLSTLWNSTAFFKKYWLQPNATCSTIFALFWLRRSQGAFSRATYLYWTRPSLSPMLKLPCRARPRHRATSLTDQSGPPCGVSVAWKNLQKSKLSPHRCLSKMPKNPNCDWNFAGLLSDPPWASSLPLLPASSPLGQYSSS